MQTAVSTSLASKAPAQSSHVACSLTGHSSYSQIDLLLNITRIFREIVDFLEDTESDHELRKFYVHLNAYNLLLTELIAPVQQDGAISGVQSLSRSILKRLSCFLRHSVLPDHETTLSSSDPFPRLTTLKYYWDLPRALQEKMLNIGQCLDFGSQDIRDEMILVLRGAVDMLRSHYPETLTDAADDYRAPRKKRRNAIASASSVASSVYQALIASSNACSSIHSHDYAARLRLATYRKTVEDNYAFETFVTLNLTGQSWQETQILAVLANQEMQKKKASIKFADQCGSSSGKQRNHRRRLAVERLCEQIEKSKSKPSMRLNLAVEDGRLWKDQSCMSVFPISRSDPPLSLEDIIISRPASLTEKVKRVLAVLLAYAILHLHGTPWLLRSRFNASNILFFRTSSAIPLKPYIHTDLMEMVHSSEEALIEAGDLDDEIDPDDFPSHPYPNIVMLAIMLMELYMIQPIQSLAEQAGMELDNWSQVDENTRYAVAAAVFEKFRAEFPDNYREAVDRCLDPNIGIDQNDEELAEDGLRRLIYEDIVQPLEDELDQGFSNTVSIDNLDEVAQTLDLGSWGQIRINQENSTNLIQGPINQPKSICSTAKVQLGFLVCNTGYGNHETIMGRNQYAPQFREKLNRTRSSSSQGSLLYSLSHENYTVGWICALPKEMAAAKAMLDETHPPLPQNPSDKNSYTLGRMGVHNVVIACLPANIIGTVAAARVADHMLYTFKSLRFGLLVGIGGGVPGSKDVRLGDVVVAESYGSIQGVVQYDFGKTIRDGKFVLTKSLNRSPDVLLTAVSSLKANHYLRKPMLETHLNEMETRYPFWNVEFSHPGVEYDALFQCDYDHHDEDDKESCQQCDPTKLVHRKPRDSLIPHIHYGPIASGDQVMRHGATRDRLRKDLNVLCFEMEAAGLVDSFPCLVIRGICDYSDSHKNKKWQGYAAATAAAYAKELLGVISSSEVECAERLLSSPSR
ncbi:hypothetical protein BGW36DRAFT_432404 [Talaromyces proteolyticus]|uniref:Nucleoside phosphorylase domain-containing protein n=1 Tax=Talaromyces proteolyticus TaxID=1131652 RepID=A0AAD4PVD8_9EURO|nr:uncharacterized protein BGW36DRAFT_432404 [Talaromyces proteolyticus]KAH8690608.1 hypothetical protein BGW36DRAFT_432404 [Talaromyces proteolyticus]